MTRMTGPDCVVMCNLINTHTHTHSVGSIVVSQYFIYIWWSDVVRKGFYVFLVSYLVLYFSPPAFPSQDEDSTRFMRKDEVDGRESCMLLAVFI